MTSENNEAPRKPARRRVTRAAGGPAAGATPDLGITLPARDEAPAPAPAAAAPAPEAPAADAPKAEAPARRSRRVSRPTSTPTTAPDAAPDAAAAPAAGISLDDIVFPARADEPAAEAPRTQVSVGRSEAAGARRAVRSLADIELPNGPAAPAADAGADDAEPAAPRKSIRSRRTKATAEDAPATASKATASKAATSKAASSKAAGTRSAAKAAPKASAPAADAEGVAPEAAAPARATRTRRARAEQPEQPVVAAEPKPAVAEPPADSAATASRAPGSSTPRLATTAMLFQAPDLAAGRRPRRAQAPAGPPTARPEPKAQAGELAAAPATKAVAETTAEAAAAEPATETATPVVVLPEPVELTGEEAAAAEEVAAIEAELVADGVELVDLGPEDLVEDEEDVELDTADDRPRRRRRRGGRGRRGGRRPEDDEDEEGDELAEPSDEAQDADADEEGEEPAEDDADETEHPEDGGRASSRRRRRRRGSRAERAESATARGRSSDEVTALKGSTRLEAKRQRRREGRDAGRRRQIITEAEFLARREAVSRSMVVRELGGRTQIAVLEDGVLVEHYVSQQSQTSMVGNVYLGRVQNVLPSMEAAFVDVGKGRNAVLYAGEVNWDAAGLEGGQPRRIEQALKSGDSVLVQVTKDPIGHKGARLTSQVTLAGRYLVLVPGGGMTGISRKLPDVERNRLKKILREVVPEGAGVIVRTAAEGASEEELRADVERLQSQWDAIQTKAGRSSTSAPALLQGEPDLAIRVVRDIFNDDFSSLVVEGDGAWQEVSTYVEELAPDLRERVTKWNETTDVFAVHRVDEQLAKGMDRKVWLPSGGSLVIDRTEAMTVVDVNTGKFTGAGGTLEETVTRNNLEAAEEIVRQLRLRDIGGIIVIDFIDMVLESNRDLVLRRLVECLGRDRTKHQVAEVTSLGLVQMTRKRVGQGLVEAFSETCEHCKGRGFIVHAEPIEKGGSSNGNGHTHAEPAADAAPAGEPKRSSRRRRATSKPAEATPHADVPKLPDDKSEAREAVKATLATIAAAAAHAHDHKDDAATPDA
ncbi:Rne/Rng family ribonuclease [Xylanimonas protaetiae]|uniref:Ribonuclease E n=1 Tax=Xylanimonas protaetiae TaxID=2509457 RepID=A0A4V0YGK7_9MICO|nr:Rne/Rng family ribonuclease [Xylanimonas protaetiae]QAY71551.1 ribonuclease E/G [Xylanimonas protaetiae]